MRLYEKDLIPGNYYHINAAGGGEIIFKLKKIDRLDIIAEYYLSTMSSIPDFVINKRSMRVHIEGHTCREAYREEINWLHMCFNKNQFIPFKCSSEAEFEQIIEIIKQEIGL